MAPRRSALDRLVEVGLNRPDPDTEEAVVLVDPHLHGDEDAICPRCMTWIEERHFVRRTVYGLLQHEVCPQP